AARDVPRKDALLFPVSFGVTFIAIGAFGGREAQPAQAFLMAVHLLTSAAVLGTSLAAMSTGHWYLSNAKLPFEILIGLCRGFVGSLVLKAIVSGVYLALRFPEYRRLEDFDLLVMGTRWVAGIILAGVLGGMALSCARRKANQSATGILYVAVVFVLIGETMSIALSLGVHPRPV
ncbi:MAG TPA: hypothetical protein VEN81_06820, partial [Planctomycetota bacterium]|nr:hypothetical protein [Planctomycetota bacterium]